MLEIRQTSDSSRRDFLKSAALTAGGLIIGFHLPLRALFGAPLPDAAGEKLVNAWLRIAPDGTVTLYVAKAEMGQGIHTALPMILAEEAELDWKHVKVEFAPSIAPYVDPKRPFTGGSSSVRTGYEGLRQAGAAAREMLIAAAAARWKVEPASCRAELGHVLHTRNARKLGYGELAEEAARLPVPSAPKLKNPAEFKIIGHGTPRLDAASKVNGKAVFGLDVRLPGMLFGAARTSPVFGGDVTGFEALAKPDGAHALVKVPGGVVVVADSYWRAQKLANALKLTFDDGANARLSSESIAKSFADALDGKGAQVTELGDAGKAIDAAATRLEAEYEVPFLAHATMEPMTCTASVTTGACELWAPSQSPYFNQVTVAKLLGIAADQVKVNSTFLGGGFGRKAEQDFVAQAVLASKAVGKPVQLIWSREEDIQHDFYRPAFRARFRAGLDASGAPVAWLSRSAGDSIMSRWFPDRVGADGIDVTSVEGAKDIKYGIPNQLVTYALVKTGVPVGFWRSVGSSQNAFFVESFIDEVAHAGKQDPYELRRKLLEAQPRHRKVLMTAAEKAGWGKPRHAGARQGIAIAESFGSIVAQVAEVSVGAGGEIRVHRVTCAIDCGPIVNPRTIEAQMQSGIVYGLSAALKGEITLKDGRVAQSNFHDYPVLMMREMPEIEVHLVPSDGPMGGVGEPGVPPIAPAVTNAIFAATGKRLRKLPIRL